MKILQLLLSTFIIFLLLASCGKDNPSSTEPDPPAPPSNPNTVSKDIGADGGEITSSDGLLTLTIPQGALVNTETITITPLEVDELDSEFDQLVALEGISEVYELGPDGLEFDQSVVVSFGSTQVPVKNKDTLSVFTQALFTSSDGTLELLDSLQTFVDFDNGSVTVKGQLSHFSPLVTSQSNNGVSFFVFDVPDMLEIGSSFTAKAQIFRSVAGPLGDIVTVPGPAMYKDRSGTPIVAVSSPPSGELPGNSTNGFTGTFDYTCNDLGLGIYQSDLSVQVIFNLDSGEIPAESYAVFLTTVDCVEALPSTADLQVTLDGDGSGLISSNPTGIDCPNDCEEEYEEGTEVTLTATPDEGSVFAGWSGDIGENESQNLSITVIMDQDRSVTASFEMEQPTDGFLQLGLFTLPVLTNPETIVVLGGPEQAFANLPEGSVPALVQGAEGFIAIDLRNGEVLLDFAGLPNNGSVGERTPLGALGVSRPNPGPNALSLIASYGQDNNNTEFGFNVFPYDIQNQSFIKGPLSPLPSTVDAFPIGGNVLSNEIVIVREGGFGINFIRYNEISDEYQLRPSSEILVSARYGFEQPVTAFGEFPEGALLVVNELGDLYFETRVTPSLLIGNLGQRIIRIRCEIPVCGATDNDGNKVPIILWDGESPPSIIDDPVTVGLGPVDLDLYRLPNGNTLIVTTGFNDNTITEIEVDVSGNVVNTEVYDLPEGCEAPGHAVFTDNPDDTNNPFIIGTCYDTDIYFINDSYNTSGWSLNAGVR